MVDPNGLIRHPVNGLLLAAVLIVCGACSEKHSSTVQIGFAATWAGHPIHCEDPDLALSDLRFYVSDISLIDSGGAEHDLLLTPDGRWQRHGVALIDLENGIQACRNGTTSTNSIARGTIAAADFVAIKFTLGVPFQANHTNPLLAEPPLGDAAMHWYWRSGYKFLRAGVSTESDGFWLHLGSTGCQGTTQNILRCSAPNRVTVEIADFSPQFDRIEIDLSVLFSGIDLHDGVRSDCSASPAELTCATPFEALGLSFGGAANEDRQHVFKATH